MSDKLLAQDDLRPARAGHRVVHAAWFSALVGPAIASLYWALRQEPGPRDDGIGDFVPMLLILGGGAYVLFGIPAFIAGALFGAWSARAPSLLASIAGAAAIGFAVAVLSSVLFTFGEERTLTYGLHFGATGAGAAVVCAAWLEYLWRHPLTGPRPWWQRKGVIAGAFALVTLAFAILFSVARD